MTTNHAIQTHNVTKSQKTAVFLLSIGTFLEYFDLMLYVHMAVMLNELFFPKTDAMTTGLLTALTFSSTFLFRPIGGLVIGWIGDRVGRKNTIIITTILMALCCLTMAALPTYAEIGVAASIIMLCCRALQGFSSMGEVVGAKLYMAESFKQPQRYVYGNCVALSSTLGGGLALIMATVAAYINWRWAFSTGAIIAVVGIIARTRLRETPEFVDYMRRMRNYKELFNQPNKDSARVSNIIEQKTDKKVVAAYFFIRFMLSICFYTSYIYAASFVKIHLGMSAQEAILQNLKANLLGSAICLTVIYLVKRHHPLKIAQLSLLLVIAFLPILPWYLDHLKNPVSLLAIQVVLGFIMFVTEGLEIVCFRHFSIKYRFTLAAFTFGIASVFSFTTVPFILEFGKQYIGHYILWVVYTPGIIGFLWAISYAKKLEKASGTYDNYPDVDDQEYDDINTTAQQNKDKKDLPSEYYNYNASCQPATDLLQKLTALNQTIKKPIDLEFVKKAIIFAKKWHNRQLRKSGEPFYLHPLAVAALVADFYPKTQVIVTAILHDIVEDTPCPIDLIKQEFSLRIAEMVERLSRAAYGQQGDKVSVETIVTNIRNLNDMESLLVKALDRLHNLQTISGLRPKKQQEFINETMHDIANSLQYAVDGLNINGKNVIEHQVLEYCENSLTYHHMSDNILTIRPATT